MGQEALSEMSEALFQRIRFTASAGWPMTWKVECDALLPEDWRTIARVVAHGVSFSAVEGVPDGGLPLEQALRFWRRKWADHGLLIVDDVLTTGTSMEEQRAGRDAQGVVLFARGPCPDWVTPVWRLETQWEMR